MGLWSRETRIMTWSNYRSFRDCRSVAGLIAEVCVRRLRVREFGFNGHKSDPADPLNPPVVACGKLTRQYEIPLHVMIGTAATIYGNMEQPVLNVPT
jgi:hypothetical protein